MEYPTYACIERAAINRCHCTKVSTDLMTGGDFPAKLTRNVRSHASVRLLSSFPGATPPGEGRRVRASGRPRTRYIDRARGASRRNRFESRAAEKRVAR